MSEDRHGTAGAAADRLTRRAVLQRWTRAGGGLGALGLLAACAGGDIGEAPQVTPAPPPTAQQLGTGGTVVALLLPLGAQGNAGIVALSMKNSAELAVVEAGGGDIRLVVKDDLGTAQGARMAAEAAVAEGAKVVIGPLFAHSVAAAAQVTRPLNIPVIAFSTDANVAGNGVFLLSFLPSGDVERIVRFEVSQNRRSFAALLPESAYGTVVEGALQQTVASAGGRVAVMERFGTDRAKMGEVARRIAPALAQADVLFIPDTPDQVLQMVQMLAANGVDLKRLRLAGTGLWDDQRLISDAMFDGAQFAAPDLSGWRAFSERYRARFGADPVRTATLSYDAVSLVTAVVRASGPDGVSIAALSSASGFSGVEGAFRFRADGTIERGLAVMEIKAGAVQVASPAPRSFAQL
ncbi:penicillin-binding protein activator [Xanthobacter sp. KR7-225]|uniref:penicillin-binding protein activator n=1 Tax=Xanthobacter sp. KR7-225 TaxID=3156613 RepID=UPI0032B5A30C